MRLCLLCSSIPASFRGFCLSKPYFSIQSSVRFSSISKMNRGRNRRGDSRCQGSLSSGESTRRREFYEPKNVAAAASDSRNESAHLGRPMERQPGTSGYKYCDFRREKLHCTQNSTDRAVNSSSEQPVVVFSNEKEFPPLSCSVAKGKPLHVRSSQHVETSPEKSPIVDIASQQNEPALAIRSDSRDKMDRPPGTERCKQGQTSPGKAVANIRSELSNVSPLMSFDICENKRGTPFKLKAPLHIKNRVKRKELECNKEGNKNLILRPGMVLLKNYISHGDQIKIVKRCRDLGLDTGGFYQPGYRDGSKLHLQMMCLGKDWDPETRIYGNQRSIDGAEPPSIPEEFKMLVKEAIHSCHAEIKRLSKVSNVEDVLPWMTPDVCIVNFYTNSGRLGLHQDRDESRESLRNGLPVVSFSIGDSAEFLYGDERDAEKVKSVILESGDVLIFGGESRHVFHGVRSILPNSAPKILVEEADLRPGRLNLTFREY